MPRPDPIDAEILRSRLVATGRWRRVDVVPKTGSTNADLAAAARAGEAAGAVLITEYQSAGRGRRDRSWTAPPGSGLAMSVLLGPPPGAAWTWLPLTAGVAVVQGLARIAPVTWVLKWPNDVLIGGRKVCGILAERVDTPAGPACVIGMGINVAMRQEDLPVPTATSLALECPAGPPPRTEVAAAVLDELAAALARWTVNADAVAADYRSSCDTLGREVTVTLAAGRVLRGRAVDVDRQGCLLVDTADGREVIGAGDVVHLR